MAKKILITGASSGIGEQTARYLSEQGYETILVARNAEKLNRMAEELPSTTYTFPMDLSELEKIEEIYQFCQKNGIILDGLVHWAGLARHYAVKMNDIDDMHMTFRVNYDAFVELVKFFSMRKYSKKGSSVIVMSSLSAITCRASTLNYSASKAALNAAVKVMAKELGRRSIRVNSLLPGYVITPMTSDESLAADVDKSQPLGFIEPEYIAYMIEFLLSDKSKYITGANIPISAGMNF